MHAFQIRDPETNLIRGIATITRDISAIKRNRDALQAANSRLTDALHELAESKRFLQAILDHSPNGIIIKDLTGEYLLINNGLEVLTGVAAATAKGKSDFDLFKKEGLIEGNLTLDKAIDPTFAMSAVQSLGPYVH